MQDAWRAYLEMALGLTEAPRKKAQRVASDLVNKGGATATQLQGLVEDLMSTGMANREALTNIVRYEVDRALGVVGLATADEVQDLTTRVRELEKELRAAQARASATEDDSVATEPTVDGDRIRRPAPLPAPGATATPATVKKLAKKAVKKAPPNRMPAAADSPAKATPPATKVTPTPAKKATPVKKAAKATPPAPAGTAGSPVAQVVDAAAATELPPARKAPGRKAAKKAAPKKNQPEA